MEYRRFELSPGQQAPEGSTGNTTTDGWIIWYGENFPEDIRSEPMTKQEIKEYLVRQPLADLEKEREAVAEAGYTCLNGIKLQVREYDLIRWTQLMTGLLAFQPPQVYIRDYDDIVHMVSLQDAMQMLGEVFAWGQSYLAETWTMKDAIYVNTEAAANG
jgi:hypothetical protein